MPHSKQDALRSFSGEGPSVTYVYLLESLSTPNARYVGITANLKRRLAEHNAGKSTRWQITTHCEIPAVAHRDLCGLLK
jgi:hypothetical protein